ncbi:MAG TPA: phosphatidylinositol-specific phospholipase C/glycerophosphodiester phosphodiesterase family protein [Bacillota bacterium]|nr:phosphatidylinositol-specific phospholipase C/glycerophosphodiester phosphodiesterase family protein [Bacillota bacterium]
MKRNPTCTGLALAILLGFVSAPLPAQTQPTPLVQAHAHNDYEHQRPLLDALDHGFGSVEADIYLVDGQLLVAHNRSQVKPERTLQALYLDPLRERVQKNGGRVYPGGPEVTLLVDFKGDWKTLYPVFRETLKSYASMLSTFRADGKDTRAVRVIITGNRAKEMFAGEPLRYACLDGDLVDLEDDAAADLIPWISHNWTRTFKWRGKGALPEAEKLKLKEIVTKAHQQGRRVRFWGAPDQLIFWTEMLANGVDIINTDDLDGAQKFLTTK